MSVVNLVDDEAAPPMVRSNATAGASALESQYSKWVLTFNNPDSKYDGAGCDLHNWIGERIDITYMAWCKEQGSSGTPHFQIYLETKGKLRWNSIKNKVSPLGLWVAPSRDSEKGREYCMHEGKHKDKGGMTEGPWEHGTFKGATQGKRNDLHSMAKLVQSGKSLFEVSEADPSTFIKFHGGIKALQALQPQERRSWMTKLIIYSGIPGSGKSHMAKEEADKYIESTGGEVYYWTAPATKTDKIWFNGYTGQKAVIINDFYGTLDIDIFKNLIDKYPFRVEIKNGSCEWLAETVWITSNQGWKSWWPEKLMSNKFNTAAIERRIYFQKEFTEVYVEPCRRLIVNEPDQMIGEVGEWACEEDIDSLLQPQAYDADNEASLDMERLNRFHPIPEQGLSWEFPLNLL